MLKYDSTPDDQKNNVPYLDNKLGIKSQEQLLEVEYKVTAIKAMELLERGIIQKLPINIESLCAIHEYLFSDLYPWAGTIRTVNLQKGYSQFYPPEYLHQGIQDFFNNLKKDKYLEGLTKEEFIELFAYYNNELNVLHPFREGNGRSKRLFLTEIARRAGWEIDLSKIDTEELKNADIRAFGNIQMGIAPNLGGLKNLIATSVKRMPGTKTVKPLKTVEQKLNRMLWVYDRERFNNWSYSNSSISEGEKRIKSMLQTKQGRKQIVEYLKYSKQGAKTKAYKETCDKLIEKLVFYDKETPQNATNDEFIK